MSSRRVTRVLSICAASYLAAAAFLPLQAEAQDRATIERIHKDRIENLLKLVGNQDRLAYAVHTLIVPIGAVASFPIPVARIRYEAVPLFEFDISQPTALASTLVQQLARQFAADKDLARIAVVGHTDSVGTDSYNYDLSLRRAWSIANLLRVNGLPAEKISVIGLGESYPISTNETPQGRALNRRVEFFLSSISGAIGPSIQGTEINPALRNSHVRCKDGNLSDAKRGDDCEAAPISNFPVQVLTSTGALRPTGEVIKTETKPTYPTQEIVERLHVPLAEQSRPHIPN